MENPIIGCSIVYSLNRALALLKAPFPKVPGNLLLHFICISIKEEILQLLAQEKSRIDAIKAGIIASFNQTLCGYEMAFEEILKVINSNVEKISNYFEKVKKVRIRIIKVRR